MPHCEAKSIFRYVLHVVSHFNIPYTVPTSDTSPGIRNAEGSKQRIHCPPQLQLDIRRMNLEECEE